MEDRFYSGSSTLFGTIWRCKACGEIIHGGVRHQRKITHLFDCHIILPPGVVLVPIMSEYRDMIKWLIDLKMFEYHD